MNEHSREEHVFEADTLIKTLRYTLGTSAFLAGLDKFFNLLTDWEKYLSPAVKERIPMSDRNFMKIVGVIEMAAGAGLLAGLEESMGCTIGAWLLGITGNLLTTGRYYDIAVRDTNMAVEAFALARLAAMKKKSEAGLQEIRRESGSGTAAEPKDLSAREVLDSTELTRVAS